MNRLFGRSAALLTLLLPGSAQAHVGLSEGRGFLTGVAHPLSGLDHIIAMVAVGLWGAQLGRPAMWILPVMFPLIMAAGGFLGLVGLPLPGVEQGIALSGVVLGAVVLLQYSAPLWLAMLIVAFFGLFHGHAHGVELPPGQNALLFSFGFVLATGMLHAAGIVVGLVHRWTWGRLGLRGAGAAVLVGGAFFLWRAMS